MVVASDQQVPEQNEGRKEGTRGGGTGFTGQQMFQLLGFG